MDAERATDVLETPETGVSDEVVSAPAAEPAPASAESAPVETPPSSVAPENAFDALQNRLTELEERLKGVPSADALIESVIKHPSLKQSQRDMIAFQLKQQQEAEIERRTALLDEMVQAGELDAAVADKRRRAITHQVKQEYAQKLSRAQQEPAASPRPARVAEPIPEVQAAAEELLRENKMTWEELTPELQAAGGALPLARLAALVARKAAARERAALKAEMKKEYERETFAVRQAERAGAAKPPPAGDPVDKEQQLKKRFRNSGKIGEYLAQMES